MADYRKQKKPLKERLFLIWVIGSYCSVVSKGTNGSYRETMEGMVPVFADSVNLWTEQFIHEVHMYTEADIVKTGSVDEISAWLRSVSDRRSSIFSSVGYGVCSKNAPNLYPPVTP